MKLLNLAQMGESLPSWLGGGLGSVVPVEGKKLLDHEGH
jgi:hypothetical protein